MLQTLASESVLRFFLLLEHNAYTLSAFHRFCFVLNLTGPWRVQTLLRNHLTCSYASPPRICGNRLGIGGRSTGACRSSKNSGFPCSVHPCRRRDCDHGSMHLLTSAIARAIHHCAINWYRIQNSVVGALQSTDVGRDGSGQQHGAQPQLSELRQMTQIGGNGAGPFVLGKEHELELRQ